MSSRDQAAELCGEKAANLQTTLIHLQWQRKHVEQRLMTHRGARELSKGERGDGDTSRTIAAKAVTTGANAAATGSFQGLARKINDNGKVGAAESAAPSKGTKKPASRSPSEVEGLEVLQLMAKGQALARAVIVVEGVLHKMEEQVNSTSIVRACPQV